MAYAAEIVVRENGNQYVAGFASTTGRGRKVESFGSWYGSQMGYRPFIDAMARAEALAAKLNGSSATEQARRAEVAACVGPGKREI